MDRKGFIGGTDAKRILEGEWHKLWMEKTGRQEPENLGGVFRVQLGIWTEEFHLDWINRRDDLALVPMANRVHHPKHTFMAANIDRWSGTLHTFVDSKHSNGFATKESMAEMYQPQFAHYCNVFDVDHGYLSFIAGNDDPVVFKITPSKAYRDELIEHELRFWWHVLEDVAPDIIPKAGLARTAGRAKDVRLDDMRTVDMSGNNKWADFAVDYIVHAESATKFEAAKKGLKELVEKDVREATGHGIKIKRTAAGSLLISEVAGK